MGPFHQEPVIRNCVDLKDFPRLKIYEMDSVTSTSKYYPSHFGHLALIQRSDDHSQASGEK